MKTFLGFDIEEWRNVRFVILQNFVVSTFILMFLWDGWEMQVFTYASLGSILEFLLLFISFFLYFDFASKLYGYIKNNKMKKAYVIFCLVMSMFVIAGTGIHFTANQIGHIMNIPMVEYYDEYLSHYMIWVGIVGLNSFFAIFQRNMPLKKSLGFPEMLVISCSGIIQGFIVALGLLESNLGMLGIIFASISFAFISIVQTGRKISKHPLHIFYTFCLMTIIVVLAVWMVKYGSFIEPSKINFGRF